MAKPDPDSSSLRQDQPELNGLIALSIREIHEILVSLLIFAVHAFILRKQNSRNHF